MTRRWKPLAWFALAVLAAGCDATVPLTRSAEDVVLPDIDLARNVSVVRLPLSGDAESASADEGEAETYCEAWERTEETWDPASGEFRSVDECTDGLGDIARVVTEGVMVNGSGEYTTTYELRDGGTIVWEYDAAMGEDGLSQTVSGVSSEGETYLGEYSWASFSATETQAHEEYELLEGSYVTDGVYTEQGFFTGTSAFDDPATPESPDYTVDYLQLSELEVSQHVVGVFDGWGYDYTYDTNADGSASYDFEHDDLATGATPDFAGRYDYAADGSGEGEYTQLFDDGSTLLVRDEWDLTTVVESWSFDDVATEQAPDQEGELSYLEDGSASGEVMFFLDGGGSQTCDLAVTVEGATTLSNCSDAQ